MEENAEKLDLLITALKGRYKDDPSANLDGYDIEVKAEDSDKPYKTTPLPLALAEFRKDYPKYRIRREVTMYDAGRHAAVRCTLYKGAEETDYLCDGFGEAIANGDHSLTLAIASRRALKDALRAAGYDLPCWEYFRSMVTGNAMTESTEEEENLIVRAAHAVEEAEKDFGPIKSTLDANPAEEAAAPSVDAPVETKEGPSNAEDAAVPVKKHRGRKSRAELAAQAAAAAPAVPAPVIAEEGKSFWDTIPESGMTQEQIADYIGKITDAEAQSCKITFGVETGHQLGELLQQGKGKTIRFYAQANKTEGTKLRLACLKVCEVHGF